MNITDIEKNLVEQIHLEAIQAKVFLLINLQGKMSADTIASKLEISSQSALEVCQQLVKLGGFIEMSATEFEAMHPRFTAVNMYRRMCLREDIKFGRNKIIDGIGTVLERHYDDVRTK